ncbi:Uncharacterised protein [Trueperella pyogenes]|nr:hypothetical protein [Trueperella pyogenes]SUO86851.1 Uncharacterised protein [Trueperella pyogenes]
MHKSRCGLSVKSVAYAALFAVACGELYRRSRCMSPALQYSACRCSNLQLFTAAPSSLMRFRQNRQGPPGAWPAGSVLDPPRRPTQNMNIASTRPVYESVAGMFKRTVDRLLPGRPKSQKNCRWGKRMPACRRAPLSAPDPADAESPRSQNNHMDSPGQRGPGELHRDLWHILIIWFSELGIERV